MRSAGDSTPPEATRLDPMSVVFYRPEVAVETFRLSLAVDGTHSRSSPLPPIPTLVKGCEGRFAIEDCGTIRLCTPGYYRKDGPSLIWDVQEGAIVSRPRVSERRDDPADIEQQRQIDAELPHTSPLSRATSTISATSLRITDNEQTSLKYGDNCLIWCTSIRPRSTNEWSLWRASLERSYDHISTVRDPHMFAQALGAMALQQRGLLGHGISFRNPQTGVVARCASLPVVYGPVIYTDERRAYIEASSTELEFVLRSMFSKTSEHQHEREYRFALLTNRDLDEDTLYLTVSKEMRSALTQQRRPATAAREAPSVVAKGCLPSPRILRCFPASPPMQLRGEGVGALLTAQARSSLHLAGVEHKSTTKTRRSVQTVDDVDYELIEQAIAEESGTPSDARIVKFTLDAGPASVVTLYDFGGLTGSLRIANQSGEATVTATISKPGDERKQVLIDNTDFDGTSLLTRPTPGLTLSYTTANPATTVKADVSVEEDTRITITATSEDCSATSSFEIILASSLGIGAPRIALVAAN